MESGQAVTNKSFLLESDPIIGAVNERNKDAITVCPNPCSEYLQIKYYQNEKLRLVDSKGAFVLEITSKKQMLKA